MCDTVYLKRDNRTFFGKNSDRSPNEAHLMIRLAGKRHSTGEELKATYVSVPQATETHPVVLLKPFWIWGAEMGYNECGLNIGNEALFTNAGHSGENGLIGMDLLRIALERCSSAEEAWKLIAELTEKYGQEGNCGYGKNFRYHNGYLIADGKRAFVLETAGRHWAVKEIRDNRATISNCISITDDYDDADEKTKGSFKARYENALVTKIACAEQRKRMSYYALGARKEPVSAVMGALRTHATPDVGVSKASTGSVCMHAGNLFGDQTTGSYAAEIGKRYFVTGSSFPCMSVFKPLSVRASAIGESEKEALFFWLKRELLARKLMGYTEMRGEYLEKAAALEKKFVDRALLAETDAVLDKISLEAFAAEEELVKKYLLRLREKPFRFEGSAYYKNFWKKKTASLYYEYPALKEIEANP